MSEIDGTVPAGKLRRVERSRASLEARLWSSRNWRPRWIGEPFYMSALVAMHAAYGGIRFRKVIIGRKWVAGALEGKQLHTDKRETLSHAAFKAVAHHALLELGYDDAGTEVHALDGYADVASTRHGVYIECGDVSPRKIVMIALQEKSEGMIIPYSAQNNTAVVAPFGDLVAYSFHGEEPSRNAYLKIQNMTAEEMWRS